METLLRRHFWLFNLLGLAAIAWLSGGVVNGFVGMKLSALAGAAGADERFAAEEAPSRLGQRLAALRAGEGAGGAMAARSPFLLDEPPPPDEAAEAVEEEPVDEEQPLDGPAEASYEVTKLPLKLLGTMVVSPESFSSATLEVNRKDQKIVTVGIELLDGQARVESIRRTYVVLKETGKLTIAPLWPRAEGGEGGAAGAQAAAMPTPGRPPRPGAAPATPAGTGASTAGVKRISDTSFQLDRAMLDKKLANLAALGQQTRVVPNYRGGKYDGFRMIGMASSSLFRDIGFENGDIIKVINGNRIDSPNKALALYEALKNKSRLTVQVERGGMLKTMRYIVR
jgi:general secretion pathway protein C